MFDVVNRFEIDVEEALLFGYVDIFETELCIRLGQHT